LPLLDGLSAEAVLADKGYDADGIVEAVEEGGAEAVIPPRSNRKHQRNYDKALYKERNLIERFFNKIKHFRRVATRYEKLGKNYMAMLCWAATIILLK
jgi:transposase